MNFTEILEQIRSQLQDIEKTEKANQQEQVELARSIERLQQEIAEKCHRQSELDREAIDLCRLSEELNEKKEKIAKIQSFSTEFQVLQAEFQGNQDLLNTLYSSVSTVPNLLQNTHSDSQLLDSLSENEHNPEQDRLEEVSLSIENIKANLPQAEKLYQQLVAKHLEQYHTYQNLIVNSLDLIWCSVAFVVFGKESYRKMCLKYHPDRQGSEQAMQLINTAWEISQEHLKTQDSN